MTLDADQQHLLDYSTAPWMRLWLLIDFETARAYAVSSLSGGTYRFLDGGSGMYATGAKGITAERYDDQGTARAGTVLGWADIRRWATRVDDETVAHAAALWETSHALQRSYPSAYPGIGRPYCWDVRDEDTHTGDGCKQCALDRAALVEASERRADAIAAHTHASMRHARILRGFFAALHDAPTDLLDLLELANA